MPAVGQEYARFEALLFGALSSSFNPELYARAVPMLASLWSASSTKEVDPATASEVESLARVTSQRKENRGLDARVPVRVTHREERWRLHPGWNLWPVDVAMRLSRMADCVDVDAVPLLGFGVGDVLEVALRLMTEQLDLPGRGAEEPEAGAHTTAVVRYLSEWTEPAAQSDQCRRAISYFRRSSADFFTGIDEGEFDCLVVDTVAGPRPLPAGLILGATEDLATKILTSTYSAKRGEDSPGLHSRLIDAEDRLAHRLMERLSIDLQTIPMNIFGPVSPISGEGKLVFVFSGARHLLVIKPVAIVDETTLDHAIEIAGDQLAAVEPGTEFHLDYQGLSEQSPNLPTQGNDSPEQFPHLPIERLREDGQGSTWRIKEDVSISTLAVVEGAELPSLRNTSGALIASLAELRRMLGDVAQAPEEFWAFLDEVRFVVGDGVLHAASLLVLWAAWHEYGFLNPTLAQEIRVVPTDLNDEARRQWSVDATATQFDDVLWAVGSPTSEVWPNYEMRGDQIGTLSFREPNGDGPYIMVSICRDPPFVVQITHDPSEAGEAALAAAFLAQDALIGGLKRLPRALVSGLLRTPDQPLAIRLARFVDQETFLRLLWVAPPGEIGLGYNDHRSRATDGPALHRQLGEALGNAAAIVRPESPTEEAQASAPPYPDEQAGAFDLFCSHWFAHPPPVAGFWFPTPRPEREYRAAVAITRKTIIRAVRSVYAHLRDAGEIVAAGGDVSGFFHNMVAPAFLKVLREELRPFDAEAALAAAVRGWDDVHAVGYEQATGAAIDLLAPWAKGSSAAETNPVQRVRAAELLIEILSQGAAQGTSRLDERDYLRLMSISAVALEDATYAQVAATGLTPVECVVLGEGIYSFRMTEPGFFDQEAFGRAMKRTQVLRRAQQVVPMPPDTAGDAEFVRATSAFRELTSSSDTHQAAIATHLLELDEALRDEWAFGLDAVVGVFGIASSIEAESDNGSSAALLSRDQIVQDVYDWTELPVGEIRAALERLTFQPLQEEKPFAFWKISKRTGRLVAHPFVRDQAAEVSPTPSLWIAPHAAIASHQAFLAYILEGRLVWDLKRSPNRIGKVLRAWRSKLDREFEDLIAEIASGCGLQVIKRMTPKRAHRQGIPDLPGEIDALCSDRRHQRIFLIEAKRVNRSIEPMEWLYDVVDFLGTKTALEPGPLSQPRQALSRKLPVVPRVLRKAAHLRKYLSETISMFGTEPDHDEWRVVPVIVTESPHPAAFVREPDLPFTIVDYLHELLSQVPDPQRGWNEADGVKPDHQGDVSN